MPNAPEPASSVLAEALLYLSDNGIEISFYRTGTTWLYFLDNVAISEGQIITKAVALGMSRGARAESKTA